MLHNSSRRAVLIILDSVGCGAAPDAAAFHDEGAHTLGHIAQAVPDFDVPNLRRLGLGKIEGLEILERGNPLVEKPVGAYGKMREMSVGKDTTTGHWEFVGCLVEDPFRTYTQTGFPAEVMDAFLEKSGCKGFLGNLAASGTQIIQELGEEHLRTGYPIVYTSADPVFQIAAHEDRVPLETLYAWCEAAYKVVSTPQVGVCRVIARPFVGDAPHFVRTGNRHDFSVPPPTETLLDRLLASGTTVTGIGKIGDIYAHRGITRSIHTGSNEEGIEETIRAIGTENGLIFTNLVDFDAKYGHRRDPQGYANALMAFDSELPRILDALHEGDLLLITADHGNDPTFPGTDHTREFVPLLAMLAGGLGTGDKNDGGIRQKSRKLGVRSSFSDIGATVGEFFGVAAPRGTSFLGNL